MMVLVGDCRETLKTIPEKSVQCCITSPPYFGLRDYGHDDQIGLEETPGKYVENMVAVFREVRRVLRDDGTLWLNLGDSYAANMSYQVIDNKHIDVGNNKSSKIPSGLKPKDLIGIPWRVAFALQEDGWYLRQDIIWHKPNPMPESVTDRCTKAHEYIFLLSKSQKYFYDNEAVKEKLAESSIGRLSQNIDGQTGSHRVPGKTNGNMKAVGPRFGGDKYGDNDQVESRTKSGNVWKGAETGTRNKRSVWTVTTKPYKGAHFATFPADLITPCVLAGTPEKTCEICGAPWERIVEKTKYEPAEGERFVDESRGDKKRKLRGSEYNKTVKTFNEYLQPTCTHENNGTGKAIILDPFGGTGTTAEVALIHNRDYILCELNTDYVTLINSRIDPIKEQGKLF